MGFFSGIGNVVKSVVGAVSGVGDTISGISSAINGFGPIFDYMGAAKANSATAAMSQEQMAFQKAMRDTQYQAAVADLKKAGLNPMLAYHNGGAAVPQGSTAVMQNEMSGAVNTAYRNAMMQAELDKLKSEAQANQSVAENQKSQALVNAIQIPKIKADTETSLASAGNLRQQTSLTEQQEYKVRAEMAEVVSRTNLNNAEQKLVEQKVINAFLEGENIVADTDNKKVNSALTQIRTKLESLNINAAVNMSEAQKTWYMKNVAPFLPDVLKSTNSAASVGNVLNR